MPFFFSSSDSRSDFSTEVGADQHRLTALGELRDLVGGGEVFFLLGAVDDVGILDAQQRLVGRNDDDFQPVDLVELGRFGFGRTGHAGQLLVHAEVILEGDGGERLVLALDLDVLFGFDRLMQSIGPAAARHEAAGELVDDEDLAVLHHVLDIAAVERMRLDGPSRRGASGPSFPDRRCCRCPAAARLFPSRDR